MSAKSPHIVFTLASLFCVGAANPGNPAAHSFTVMLTGQAEATRTETPGLSGDPDGTGQVRLAVDPDQRRICYDFALSGVATPLMAHIHKSKEKGDGPTVVTLFTGPGGKLEDCVEWTEKWLAAIVADPARFHVSLATTEFPDGALRGQLGGGDLAASPIEQPDAES